MTKAPVRGKLPRTGAIFTDYNLKAGYCDTASTLTDIFEDTPSKSLSSTS